MLSALAGTLADDPETALGLAGSRAADARDGLAGRPGDSTSGSGPSAAADPGAHRRRCSATSAACAASSAWSSCSRSVCSAAAAYAPPRSPGETEAGSAHDDAERHPVLRRPHVVGRNGIDHGADTIGDAGVIRLEVERGAVGAAQGDPQGLTAMQFTHGRARYACRADSPRAAHVAGIAHRCARVKRGGSRSAAADERHLRRHHRHGLHVRVERQPRHVGRPPGRRAATSNVGSTARRSVRLQHALRHPRRHVGAGVADVDLPAGDVVRPAVERRRLGEARDACLVAVYGAERGRGEVAEMDPLLMIRPPRGVWRS